MKYLISLSAIVTAIALSACGSKNSDGQSASGSASEQFLRESIISQDIVNADCREGRSVRMNHPGFACDGASADVIANDPFYCVRKVCNQSGMGYFSELSQECVCHNGEEEFVMIGNVGGCFVRELSPIVNGDGIFNKHDGSVGQTLYHRRSLATVRQGAMATLGSDLVSFGSPRDRMTRQLSDDFSYCHHGDLHYWTSPERNYGRDMFLPAVIASASQLNRNALVSRDFTVPNHVPADLAQALRSSYSRYLLQEGELNPESNQIANDLAGCAALCETSYSLGSYEYVEVRGGRSVRRLVTAQLKKRYYLGFVTGEWIEMVRGREIIATIHLLPNRMVSYVAFSASLPFVTLSSGMNFDHTGAVVGVYGQ
jgi:hypothetical protein